MIAFPRTISMSSPQTRYSAVTKRQASLIVGAIVLLIAYGLMSLNQAFPPRELEATDGEDARMYQSIIERVHAGGNYYDIVGEELRTRGYASRPFFNWRLPTIAWTIGQFPNPEWGRWALVMFAFLTMVLWFQVLDREKGFPLATVGALLFCGPTFLCLSEQGFYYHELWSGMFIACSLAAHARGNRVVSIIVGVLALFIRELALPYVLIMLVLAWRKKQEGEMVGWLAGLTFFGLGLTYHASVVSNLLTPMDQVNEPWIQFGGWPFVLSTGSWNAFLLVAPQWTVAVVLPLALLGVAGWRGEIGMRVALTLGAYFAAFLIAGRANNTYWGLMYAPLVPLGFLFAVPALVDLTRKFFGRSHSLPT